MADNTAASAAQLVDFSQRIGSVAKTANLAKEANIAFGTTLIGMGTPTEVAATGIKQLYLELGKGADTKKKMDAFRFLGINGDSLAQDMARDAEGTILKVLDKINAVNPGDKISLLTNLFGEQAVNSISTLANNTDKLRENLSKAKSEMSQGAVDKEYANRMNTLANQLKIVRNQFINTVADLGESLTPVVTNILKRLQPMVENLANWIKQNPQLTGSIMKIIGAITLFTGAIAGVIKFGVPIFKAINFIYMEFSKLNAIFPIIKFIVQGFMWLIRIIRIVGLAIKMAFLSNPIGVIIVAIIAVIAILVLLYKKNENFRNFVNKMWKQIAQWVISAWNRIKSSAIVVFNFLKPFINLWISNIISYFRILLSVAKGIWQMLSGVIRTQIAIWKGIFQLFVAFFTGKWDEIPGIVSGIWNSIKTGMSGFVEGAKNILSSLFNWFGGKWEELKSKASNLLTLGRNKEQQIKIGQNYSGTNSWKGGLTTVAERGAELLNIPKVGSFVAQNKMLLNLPSGTEILNNRVTRNSIANRVMNLKNRITGIKNNTSNNNYGGDINIHITVGSGNPVDIGREVKKVMQEIMNKKARVSI